MGAPASTDRASTRPSIPRRGRPTPCHAGRKRPNAAATDRLDLGAQHGQRAPAELPQHLRIAPLPLGTARPELAADQAAVGHHRVHHRAERAVSKPNRSATSRSRNGPCVRP